MGLFDDDGPAPDTDEVDRYNRYMLDVDGKGKKPYTRATTIAKTLENTYNLNAWGTRCLAKGVAQRPDLVARAATTPVDDKKNWKEIFAQAEVIAAGGAKANLGTAFHALHENVATMTDDEYAAVPHDLRVTYEKYRAELVRLGIVEILTESTCAVTSLGVAGKLDALMRLSDGRVVVADRKSGRVVEYPHSACTQMATYANADMLLMPSEGGPKWLTMHEAFPDLDRTTGLVIDVRIGDEATAAVHVYEVDLHAGWWSALEAVKVRRWRARRDLITPYQPEVVPPKWEIYPATPPAVIEQAKAQIDAVLAAGPELEGETFNPDGTVSGTPIVPIPGAQAEIEKAWGFSAQQVVDGEHKDLAARIRAEAAVPTDVEDAADEVPEAGEPAPKTLPEYAQKNDAENLLSDKRYKTKAHMQALARKLDPAMPVNRTRANLAADIVAHPAWVDRWPEFLAATSSTEDWKPSAAEVAQATPSGHPAWSSAQEKVIQLAPDGTQVQSEFPNSGLPVITGQTGVVAEVLPGPAQDNPYAVTEDPPHAPVGPEDSYLLAISQALNKGNLAEIWQDAQSNGVEWSARLQQAAAIKLASFT